MTFLFTGVLLSLILFHACGVATSLLSVIPVMVASKYLGFSGGPRQSLRVAVADATKLVATAVIGLGCVASVSFGATALLGPWNGLLALLGLEVWLVGKIGGSQESRPPDISLGPGVGP